MIREFNEMRDVKLQKKLAMQERGMEKILTFLERFNKDKK